VTADDRVLLVRQLRVAYGTAHTPQEYAVDGVDLELVRGEILGLVGESGSGKSSLALAVAGLLPRSATTSAEELVIGDQPVHLDSSRRDRRSRRNLLGRRIGVVFQDPTASLDPTMPIGRQIEEPLRVHTRMSARARRQRVAELFERTGLSGIDRIAGRYPHELSGGQRQRVMLSIALACEPELIIADEPTTALDVTVQAEILELFRELRRDLGISALFVSHDLAVVGEIADRVAVMYGGRIVESGPTAEVLQHPKHAYSRALLSCVPRLGAGRGVLQVIDPGLLVQPTDDDPAQPGAQCTPSTGPLLIGAVLEPGASLQAETESLPDPDREA